MATMITIDPPAAAPAQRPSRRAAVLTSGCDGYRAGTTGEVIGERDGCIVFAPDRPQEVARWARPRTSVLVPTSLILAL